ncbi:MAG: hypothetical protein QXP80_01865 [Zestosphaera sp.]
MRRLVVFLGYDDRSSKILRKVSRIKHLFDDLSVIYVPEVDSDTLRKLSLPSVKIEVDDSPLDEEDLLLLRGEGFERIVVDSLMR